MRVLPMPWQGKTGQKTQDWKKEKRNSGKCEEKKRQKLWGPVSVFMLRDAWTLLLWSAISIKGEMNVDCILARNDTCNPR
jgi:hypothetical protein